MRKNALKIKIKQLNQGKIKKGIRIDNKVEWNTKRESGKRELTWTSSVVN